MFLIGLDTSKSEENCISSLQNWLKLIQTFLHSTVIETSKLTRLQNCLSAYLQALKTDKLILTDPLSQSVKHNFGVPIVVVGCKSDIITVNNNFTTLTAAKELQAKLRTICLQFGAALIYTSVEKNTNIALLRKYIIHRLYSDDISLPLSIDVSPTIFYSYVIFFIRFMLLSYHIVHYPIVLFSEFKRMKSSFFKHYPLS